MAGADQAVDSKASRCGNPTLPMNGDEINSRTVIEDIAGSYETIDPAVEWVKFNAMLKIYLSPSKRRQTASFFGLGLSGPDGQTFAGL